MTKQEYPDKAMEKAVKGIAAGIRAVDDRNDVTKVKGNPLLEEDFDLGRPPEEVDPGDRRALLEEGETEENEEPGVAGLGEDEEEERA